MKNRIISLALCTGMLLHINTNLVAAEQGVVKVVAPSKSIITAGTSAVQSLYATLSTNATVKNSVAFVTNHKIAVGAVIATMMGLCVMYKTCPWVKRMIGQEETKCPCTNPKPPKSRSIMDSMR